MEAALTPPKWIGHQRDAEYTATRWWRVLLQDGTVWMETGDEEEARKGLIGEDGCRQGLPEGARVQRLHERCALQWRDV